MNRGTALDPSRRVDLYMRTNRINNKAFTFLDSDGSAYNLVYTDFNVILKRYAGDYNTLTTLEAGSGLTMSSNVLTMEFNATQSNLNPGEYYWELLNIDTNQTWLSGKVFIHDGEFDGVDNDTSTVTINLNGDSVTVTLSVPGTGLTFGGVGQIPHVNDDGNGFNYLPTFIFKRQTQSITLGTRNSSTTEGTASIVIGDVNGDRVNSASGSAGIAIGYDVDATGSLSIAHGLFVDTNGQACMGSGTSIVVDGDNAHAFGNTLRAEGDYSTAIGISGLSSGDASFSGGRGSGSTLRVTAAGSSSFNFSMNDNSQTIGHGALASGSVILGGLNVNIESGNTRAVAIGLNGGKLTGTTYIDHTAVHNLAIIGAPTVDNTQGGILVRNPTTGIVNSRTMLSGSATLDFTNAGGDLTITVTGAVSGDAVMLGVPDGSTTTDGIYTAWVSAADTVTVRYTPNGDVADPASGTFNVIVIKQ